MKDHAVHRSEVTLTYFTFFNYRSAEGQMPDSPTFSIESFGSKFNKPNCSCLLTQFIAKTKCFSAKDTFLNKAKHLISKFSDHTQLFAVVVGISAVVVVEIVDEIVVDNDETVDDNIVEDVPC